MKFIQANKQLAAYLLLLAAVGMILVILVTHRFGPGISTDGARYLSTAQNLAAGRGLYDYLDIPLTQFPPLYSILIAGVSLITGMDVFPAAQVLNILSFGLVIWLAGYFFSSIFPHQQMFAYVGSAVLATSLSLLVMASNILSDLLFLAFVLAFLIAATDVLETGRMSRVLLMGCLAAISPFQRYAGLTLILTGALLVLLLFRKNIGKAILFAGGFAALASLPILLWVYFHNYVQTGILFGVRMPPVYWGNLQVTIEKAAHWFVPATLTNVIPLWEILAILMLFLVSGNRLADWGRWARCLVSAQFLPSLLFFVLYLGVLVFNVSYWEVRYPYMDRIHIMMLPALLALMFLTVRELTPGYLRSLPAGRRQILSIGLFLIWLSFPLYNLQKYLGRAYVHGDVSEFNMYNIAALRDAGLQEFLASLPDIEDQNVYSNYEAAAWFLTRHEIRKLPFGDVDVKRVDPEAVLRQFPSWPGKDGDGYVIWIKALSFKPYVLTPEQLAVRADFQMLYSDDAVDVYLITPK